MANMNFDFNKIQRSFFKTTLKDGRELVVKMPMKKTFEKITMKYMTDNYDTEEMGEFIKGFMNFVTGVKADPN